jgi:Uri superfamily endonuclease
VLESVSKSRVRIGALGWLRLRPGFYIYVGSGFGPGGVRARVRRHLRASGQTHWHVDHLRPYCRPVELWYSLDTIPREHLWAATLADVRESSIPLRRFGASDCRCHSHLFLFPRRPMLASFRRRLGRIAHDHAAVRRLLLAAARP